ncbi:phage tail tape measure protein [Paenibacillus wynnii]|uniref:phage tail tape measure protein n=1 Tax=Paenibacillus wynnii TaxID=268407 RepID=UPI00069104E9|nr:phage tail tape measure protein [Paenibacillus wynnii]
MAGKEYKIAFELQAKLDSSYNTGMRKVLDNLNDLETKARSIEAIRISGDLIRPLREGLQATLREFDELRRMPSFTGLFTEMVKELKEAVQQSTLLQRSLQEIARIRMPSNMFGNDIQRYTRDMQDLERRMREINDIQGPQPGDSGSGGGGEDAGGSSGAWALGGAALAGGVGVAAVAGLALAGHAVFSFSEDYKVAMNQISASTGASEKEMEGFSDIAENLYNSNMGENFYDIAESLSVVRQVTKQSGQALQDATMNGMVYADVFGEEIAESTKAADTMMKNFGITSTEAYNLLAQGAQKGLNKSGELLDTANEYSGYFSKLGFSADGMFDTFAAGLDAGAFNLDKVGDGIKEFGIRTKDGSKSSLEAYKTIGLNGAKMTAEFATGGKTAQQAFLKTAKSISSIKDPVVQNAVAVQLFGTQAEDLESRVINAYSNVESQFDKTKNTMEEIGKVKYDSIGQAFGGMGRTLQTSLILPISKTLLPLFSGMANKMTTWVPAVVGAFGKVGGAVKEAYTNVQRLFKNGFDGEMEGVTVNYLTAFGMDKGTAEKIASTISSVYESVAGVVDKIKGMFSGGGMDIAAMFGIKGSDMKEITSGFKDIFGELVKYWSDFIGNLVGLWPSIQKMIGSVLSIIPKLLPVFGKIGTAAVTGFQAIYKAIIPIVSYLSSNLWPIISKVFTFLSTQVFPKVTSMISGLIPPIMMVVGKAGDLFKSIGTAITFAFSVVKPILDTVFAAFNFAWPAIQVVVTNAIDMIGGVIKGLLKSLGGIIDFVTGVFSGDWGKAWGGIRDTFSGIFDGLGAILTFPINVAVDAINAAIRGINKVSFDIPDWVPKLGGEHFGISIPEIPKLGGYAKGGYVDSPEVAWVGEGNSPEWIIPENNSARSQGLLQAANRSMGGGNAGGNTVGDFVYNPTFIIQGNANENAIRQMDQRNQQEFGKQFSDYKRQAMRVSLST